MLTWILIVMVAGGNPTYVRDIASYDDCIRLASETRALYVTPEGTTTARTKCVQVTVTP